MLNCYTSIRNPKMKTHQDIYEKIRAVAVVPVVAIDSVDAALPLADALIAGGLPVAEITFRTPAAADIIKLLTKQRPELLLGAGTLLNVDDLKRAKSCGAEFAVAPCLDPDVVKTAMKIDLPFAPGVMTPTDIEQALSLGVTKLKFFPAEAAGGIKFLESISAPYKHLGARFIPTGGINAGNMTEYLRSDVVLAVGGTWVAKRDDIAAGNWSRITDNCRQIRSVLSAGHN